MLISCNQNSQGIPEEYYVVESYLVANRDLPQVSVSKTAPIDKPYIFEDAALSNANVQIQQLNSVGGVVKTYMYQLQLEGVYQPVSPEPVLPEHEYKLKVSFPNEDVLESTTFVPGAFNARLLSPDSLTYQSSELIHFNVDPSFYPGRSSYYVLTANAVNPSSDKLTPFYTARMDITGESISDYYINSLGIKNEENFQQNDNGTLDVKLPWMLIAFYGTNNIVLNTIDENLYDFVRYKNVQTGGRSTLAPGQAQNINYNIKGGIGIFGSMASDTASIFIQR
jgi:hypothetical protein